MHHVNVVKLHHAYYKQGSLGFGSILNIIMDYIPMTVDRVIYSFQKLQ